MNSPQKLQDAFEDAYFAILMDAYAESEGERLLAENKRLATEPMDLPEGMDARVTQAIGREFQKLRWRKIARAGRRVVSRVAVVVLAVVVLFTALCISSSAFRERVLNIVQSWNEKYTSFAFSEDTGVPAETVPHEPYWLPDGYEKTISKDNSCFCYEDSLKERIFINIFNYSYISTVDTENAESTENIIICGNTALAIIKNGSLQIAYGDIDNDKFISIICDNLNKNEAVKIAESMYE